MELKQYQIVIVNLDPTMGSEMKKARPCVIISPDELNHRYEPQSKTLETINGIAAKLRGINPFR